MPRTLIALATYNERDNLPILLDAIFKYAPDCDVLVVDDSSPDQTGDWVRERGQTELRLKLLQRKGKLGLGTAILDAIRYAIEHDYDFLLNMDADRSHAPESIPLLRDRMGPDCDVAIGSRYIAGGNVVNWPLSRRLMSRLMNLYVRIILGLNTRDNSGSFRCYKVEVLKKLDLSQFHSRGYSFFEEILYRLKRLGAQWVEVPICFTDRTAGESKINIGEVVSALWTITLLRIRP